MAGSRAPPLVVVLMMLGIVIQDVSISAVPGSARGSQEVEHVIVRGVLEYQACVDLRHPGS
jgi:hypothetical protein